MNTSTSLPSLIGYAPEEAEALARAAGYAVVWLEGAPPRWLPPRHAPRVIRQRLLEAQTVELLRAEVPVVGETEAE